MVLELKHKNEIFDVLVERKYQNLHVNNVSPMWPAVLDFVRDNHYYGG
jgi:hypothetical protein